MKILMMIEGVTTAHTSRSLIIAKSLAKQGHKVILASTVLDSILKNETPADIQLLEIPNGITPSQFSKKLHNGEFPYTVDQLKKYVEVDCTFLKNENPDVVFGDFRLSLQVSAKLADTPYVNLTNIIWSPYSAKTAVVPEVPPTRVLKSFGITVGKLVLPMILNSILTKLNEFRSSYGLDPVKSLEEFYTQGDYIAYLDDENLMSSSVLPSHHCFLGPVVYRSHNSSVELKQKLNSLPKNKNVILVTPGSSGNSKAFQKSLNYLVNSEYEVLVAGVNPSSTNVKWPTADNIHYVGFVNLADVLPLVDAVVANGGSPMSYMSLQFQKPILNLPSNMDQHFNSQAFDQKNVSRTLRTELVSKTQLFAKLKELTTSEWIQQNLAAFAKNISHSQLEQNLSQLLASIPRKTTTANYYAVFNKLNETTI